MNRPAGSLRARMAALIGDAARQGFPGADRLWDMGLRQARLELEAFAARRRAEAERDERAAWMAGYYAAIAVHAPRRYPRRSGTAFRFSGAPRPMSEAQMKEALAALAAAMGEADRDDA